MPENIVDQRGSSSPHVSWGTLYYTLHNANTYRNDQANTSITFNHLDQKGVEFLPQTQIF